ncbi:PH domain-containing protein [Devriesea agamarum]|uniref:hypothetical protein n=1 Tax=Devriesea agamarum TaxID=472569 RepID=UPI00071DF890|nr:hypothetical protein [Devriesea agamarum]
MNTEPSKLPYRGTTRPAAVGWTRIGVTFGAGIIIAAISLLRAEQFGTAWAMIALTIFTGMAMWSYIRMVTTFTVDKHGITVRWGGFWPQRTWPASQFRSVHLREIPSSILGVTVGGVGWRRGRVMAPEISQLRPVGGLKIFTTGNKQDQARMLVTRPGTQVEIITTDGGVYLISPDNPVATGEAVAEVIRTRK